MGARNELFRKKYNELDQLCRARYDMFRTANGRRENKSAIVRYANELPPLQREKLLTIVKVRNDIIHNDVAEVNQSVIRDLDTFIAMVKQGGKGGSSNFELVSYINLNTKKMNGRIAGLREELDDEDLPYNKRKQLLDKAYSYIDQLKNAKTLDAAKRIVRDFYGYCDNIDDHPVFVQSRIVETRREAIADIHESLNDVLDERVNPFVRNRAKAIAQRYINLINTCNSEEEIEDLAEQACNALDELY